MKTLNIKISNTTLSSSIIFMIFGIILFLFPSGVFSIVSIILGSCLLLYGIFQISLYANNSLIFKINGLSGMFFVIMGILLIFNTNFIATIIPVFIGVFILSNGIRKLKLALEFKEQNIIDSNKMIVASILEIIIGIIIIANPISGAFLATRIVGAIIIAYSIIEIICGKKFDVKTKDNVKIIEER